MMSGSARASAMPTRRRAALILTFAALAALTLAGCSSGSSPASTSSPSSTGSGDAAVGLLDRLAPEPGVPAAAVVVNVTQVRSLLGLPASASPLTGTDPAQQRFSLLLAAAVPLVNSPYPTPARTAIDFGQVTAVATNPAGKEQVAVVATTQSFARLAATLSAEGYSRTGDLLVMRNPPFTARSAGVVAIAGAQGIIALGNDPDAVRAAAEGHAPGLRGPVRDALASLSAPAAQAYAPTGTCVTAVAISDDISGDAGRLLVLAGSPQAARLTAGRRTDLNPDPMHLGTVSVSGQQLTAPYTYGGTNTPFNSFFETELAQVYQC
jgi:hypothetical protein